MPVRRQKKHQGAPQGEANSENFEPADDKLWCKGRHHFLQEGHGAHVSDMFHAWRRVQKCSRGMNVIQNWRAEVPMAVCQLPSLTEVYFAGRAEQHTLQSPHKYVLPLCFISANTKLSLAVQRPKWDLPLAIHGVGTPLVL